MFRILTAIFTLLAAGAYAQIDHSTHGYISKNKLLESEMQTGHMHRGHKFMLTYSYMDMNMEGIKSGTDSRTVAQVNADYMMAPVNMNTKMHMLGAMYGVTPKVTGMVMLNYLDKRMEMQRSSGAVVIEDSSGFGDIKLKAKYAHKKTNNEVLATTLGISLPTGSIDKKNSTGGQMAYSMQMGSGTYDITLEESYFKRLNSHWAAGGKGTATIRTGKNDRGYRLGNIYEVAGFVTRKLPKNFEVTANISTQYTGRIKGSDNALNANMMPGNNTNNYGGTKVVTGLEIAYKPMLGAMKGHQLSLGVKVPVYQNLKGIQLANDYALLLNWRKMF